MENQSPQQQEKPQHISVSLEEKPKIYAKIALTYVNLWKDKPFIALLSTIGLIGASIVAGDFALKDRAIKKEPVFSITTGSKDPFEEGVTNPALKSLRREVQNYPNAAFISIEKNEIYPFALNLEGISDNEYNVDGPDFQRFRKESSKIFEQNKKKLKPQVRNCHALDLGRATIGNTLEVTACAIHTDEGKLVAMTVAKDESIARKTSRDYRIPILALVQN